MKSVFPIKLYLYFISLPYPPKKILYPLNTVPNIHMKNDPFSPYLGVTHPTDASHVARLIETFRENIPRRAVRRLQIGVMTEDRMPPPNVKEIFISLQTMNCLHFVDRGTRDRDHDLGTSLCHAIEACGMGINALQLNIPWPDPGQIANGVHTSRKPLEIILQIGRVAFGQADNNPDTVVRMLKNYEGVIHHILLDRSAGKGVAMDANLLLPFARAIRNNFPSIGLGFAGGLGPDTMDLAGPLLKEYPCSSVDAAVRLRPPGGKETDPLDIDRAEVYIIEALEMLK